MLRMKGELIKKGISTALCVPSSLKLSLKSEKSGCMICYTYDSTVSRKIQAQIAFMCESFTIPVHNKFNAGYAVKLQLDKLFLTSVIDVACIDALVSIYRDVR